MPFPWKKKKYNFSIKKWSFIRTFIGEQSRIQKLHWIQKLGIQKLLVGFRNYFIY